MLAITKYRALDGSEWNSSGECVARDTLVNAVKDAMSSLALPPRKIEPEEYFQHDPTAVVDCRCRILKLAAKEFPSFDCFRHEPPSEVHPRGIVGRILDDCGGPINTAWGRFMRIDDQGREWEQPYYAINGAPKAVCINPVAVGI